MSAIYVHTLGDSTLDNVYWMFNDRGDNADQAKRDSVEGQLQKQLGGYPEHSVISHAYDGFTTSSVLDKGIVGGVLPQGNKFAYLRCKKQDADSMYLVCPLKDLKGFIEAHPQDKHYVVISVAGNDFRERLGNPFAMVKEIPNIHKRYLQIVKEVKSLKDKNVQPILVFQYRLDAADDHYGIYNILKKIGMVFAGVQWLSVLGMGASAMALVARKIRQPVGIALFLWSSAVLALSQRVIPLKVTKGVLLGGQKMGMAALGGLMETFYRPILAQAKADRIPILDLPNTFNPYDHELYISQIEPSKKGGELIAEGLAHIIKRHDFSSGKSMMYSKDERAIRFAAIENPGSSGWSVAYPENAPSS